MTISLIIPCYNPPQDWAQTICERYNTFCSRIEDEVELIIVMDGESATVTKDALSFLEENIGQLKLVRYAENRGKGYAVRQGVAIASGEIILYTDIDFPYTMESMYAVYKGLKNDEFDVGVGVKNQTY